MNNSCESQQPALKRLKTASLNHVSVSESSESFSSETESDNGGKNPKNRSARATAPFAPQQLKSPPNSSAEPNNVKSSAQISSQEDGMTEEERRKERRAANRLSAFKSRQRRKNIIKDLQEAVASLMKDNADQHWKINQLKQELATVKRENESIRGQIAAAKQRQLATATLATPATTTPSLLGTTSGIGGMILQQQHQQNAGPKANALAEGIELIKELAVIEKQLAAIRNGEQVFPSSSWPHHRP